MLIHFRNLLGQSVHITSTFCTHTHTLMYNLCIYNFTGTFSCIPLPHTLYCTHTLLYCRSIDEAGSDNTPLNNTADDLLERKKRNSSKSKSPSPRLRKSKEMVETEVVETEEERKARIDEELAEFREELLDASSSVNLRPLGMDRHHSKYWVFPNLPGLYVEKSDQALSHQQDTVQTMAPADVTQPQENDKCDDAPADVAQPQENDKCADAPADVAQPQENDQCADAPADVAQPQENDKCADALTDAPPANVLSTFTQRCALLAITLCMLYK